MRNEVIVVAFIAAVPPNEGRGSDVAEQYDRPMVAVRCFRGTGILTSFIYTLELKDQGRNKRVASNVFPLDVTRKDPTLLAPNKNTSNNVQTRNQPHTNETTVVIIHAMHSFHSFRN